MQRAGAGGKETPGGAEAVRRILHQERSESLAAFARVVSHTCETAGSQDTLAMGLGCPGALGTVQDVCRGLGRPRFPLMR